MPEVRIGVDVGGTFTDVVAFSDNDIFTAKVPSTVPQSQGVLAGIARIEHDPADVTLFSHGTTVGTNALLERRGARTVLVTTEGFRDLIEIGRQNRPELYDLTKDRPPALVERELRFAVKERMSPQGRIEPLDTNALGALIERVRKTDAEAVAVCLLFSYLHPEHESTVGEALRSRLDHLHVSLSHEVLPEFREYERFSTTVADAYLGPKLAAYLSTLRAETLAAGLPSPAVMQSSGGVIDIEHAARNAAACVLSGPAAGVVGAAYVCRLGGHPDVLTFDMGGTSTDVAPVLGGEPAFTTAGAVGGVPIGLPMTDVHTVGAGGGSIAWIDEGGALRVGPQSAGADPGPACYGLGGKDPTVTDANLALGYLRAGASLGGSITLDVEAALEALAALGKKLDLDPPAVALGIVRVANAEMLRALRVVSVQRGIDPRALALVAFGGAGPLHACALADELEVATVLIPRSGGVLSALGLVVSDQRRDYAAPLMGELDKLQTGQLDEAFETLERRALADLPGAVCTRRADLRYRGQSFELTVAATGEASLVERFRDAHRLRYGYAMDDEIIEIVGVRITTSIEGARPELSENPVSETPRPDRREIVLEEGSVEAGVLQRDELGYGSQVEGPCIISFEESTALVPPGWRGEVDAFGTLVVRRS